MNAEDRRSELRSFLVERRGRLLPADVGLPSTARRRVPGLRREEVAELAGVSHNWYAFFEAGNRDRRFSAAFVQRVADALRLNERERVQLLRYALPEVSAATEHVERSVGSGLNSMAKVREFSRKILSVSSFEEGAIAAAETLQEIVRPTSATVANIAMPAALPKAVAIGPSGEFSRDVVARQFIAVNYPSPFGKTTYNENRPARKGLADGSFSYRQHVNDGRSYNVHYTTKPKPEAIAVPSDGPVVLQDVTLDAHEFWMWNEHFQSRAGLIHGLFHNGCYRGNLAALWTEPHMMTEAEIEVVQTLSAILELASASS